MVKKTKIETYTLNEFLRNGKQIYNFFNAMGGNETQEFIEKGIVFLAKCCDVDISNDKDMVMFLNYAMEKLKNNILMNLREWKKSFK